MKTLVCLFIALVSFVFNTTAEKKYVIKKVTDEGSNFFDMNSLGEIVYVGVDEKGNQQVYLYSAGVNHQLTQTPSYAYGYSSIDINDKGHIVWSMYSSENPSKLKYVIMFYKGTVTKLIDNLYYDNYDPNVKINNSDLVVFHQIPYYGGKMQCYRFDGKIHNLGGGVNNPNMNPVINDNGLISWFGDNRWENDWNYRIRYTTPGDTIMKTISQGIYEGSSAPCVDNLNNIFFQRYDNGYYDLYRFSNNQTTKIADSIYHYYAANNGYVVYTKGSQNNYTVFRFSPEGNTILDKEGDYYHPTVNSTGICVWRNGNNEIFTNRDGGTKKIGGDCHKPPIINNEGTICFAGYDWDNYGSALYVAEYRDVSDITGRIVQNQAGGLGLSGVEIVADNKVLTTTDVNGNFTCTNLDLGNYTISFRKQGYSFNPVTMTVNLQSNYQLPNDVIATPATAVSDINAPGFITIYPNPSNTELKIKFSDNIQMIQEISIVDISGRTVKESVHSAAGSETELTIDVSELHPGFYALKIKTNDQLITKLFQILR